MASGNISRPGVQIGSGATEAWFGAAPQFNQLMQLNVKSSLGSYVLIVTTNGISLYDNDAGATIGRLNWGNS